MHSSRMRTAYALTIYHSIRWRVGGSAHPLDADPPSGCRTPPQMQIPLDADPADTDAPSPAWTEGMTHAC